MRALLILILFWITYCSTSQTQGSPQLLFANRRDIRIVDAGHPQSNSTIVISGLDDAAAVDFLYEDGLVFWTDVSLEAIQCTSGNSSHAKKDIITTGLVSPDGLACDWVSKKLYWTNSDTNRIEVSNVDGSYRKVLFWEGLDQPRAIALDPLEGYMYWSDWGEEPKIEKAAMDGNPLTRQKIIETNIQWPNGLTLDYDTQPHKLYWADAKLQSISVCNLDGSGRRNIITNNLPHPFSLTVYLNKIYWTDWKERAIFSCDKLTGLSKRRIHNNIYSPMYIHAFSASKQPSAPASRNPCKAKPCSHLCLLSPSPPYYSCACPTGILLRPDNHTCSDGFHEILLLARRTDLRRISLDTHDYTDVVLQVLDIRHAVAIDFDHVEDYVYWTDDETRAISRAHLDGSGQEIVVGSEVESPDGVAVDWIARNLYWTDTGTNRIEVSRLNGTSRKVLLSEDLDEPRAITLDPYNGYMYWTDWGKLPKIERAFLDGTGREHLVNKSIVWPNGLALDFVEKKLYWGDARTDKIEVINMDGTNRRILLSGPDVLPHIFGFTLLGDYIYWTDWQRRTIERMHKHDETDRVAIVDLLPDLMGLKAVNMSTKQISNICGQDNGGCSHLCFMRPSPLEHVCACPMGLELMKDSKTCIVPEAFLLFAHRTDIRRISLEFNNNNVIIPLQGVREATALDFDINDSRIYWTDTDLKSISRAFMNGSSAEHIVEFGLDFPEGMAVDWVAHNLYWADTGTSRIEMSRMDGSSRRVLIWQEVEPRALVLNPPHGHMFFSNWYKNPRIERANLDGSNRIPLIPQTGRVNGLTIDFLEQRLYWASVDSRIIESSNLLGEERVAVVSGLMHPFSLTQYQDFIYWADWNSKSIERANKTSGQNRTQIQGKMEYIMDILIFHNSRQSGWNSCGADNGGCSHLCVAQSSSNNTTHNPHRCACPTHYTLAVDNRTCIPPAAFLLCSQKNSISRMLPNPNDAPHMVLPIKQIRNTRAVDYDPLANNIFWVDKKSKSIKFANINGSKVETAIDDFEPYDLSIDVYTRHIYWTDAQENVIRLSKLDGSTVGVIVNESHQKPRAIAVASLHGYIFWTNMADPPRIERADLDGTRMQTQFSTELGIPGAIAVDSKSARIFWTDLELQMISTADFDGSNRKVLVGDEILHPVGLTVLGDYLYWVDRESEVMQRMNKITGLNRDIMHTRLQALRDVHAVEMITLDDITKHPCATNNGGCSHICVASFGGNKRCSCPIGEMLTENDVTCAAPPTCQPDYFSCIAGNVPCIPMAWRCDGETECEDDSDEEGCQVDCSPEALYHKCGKSGGCVSLQDRCDNSPDCADSSDEKDCPPCPEGMFLCVNAKKCIDMLLHCNNFNNCVTGEDEFGCPQIQNPGQPPAKSQMVQYLIAIVIVLLFLIGILLLIVFMCRRKTRHVLLEEPQDLVHYKNHLGDTTSDLAGTLLGANGAVRGPMHCNLLGSVHTKSTTNNSCVTFNTLGDQSSSGPPYDRNHVTGASSSSSSVTHYPKETLNPPPSPITDGSVFTGVDEVCSSANSLLDEEEEEGYRHYPLSDIPPHPTPASTDICDDSEPPYRSTTRRKTRSHRRAHSTPRSQPHHHRQPFLYECDPLCPPPPTPRSGLSCPPSPPSTERSFFNAYPHPPSSVGSSEC